MIKERIIKIIYGVIDEINLQVSPKERIEKSADAILFGRGGKLDSLGLVNFIVGLEEKAEEEFGVSLVLADENTMTEERSPFRSVSTLVDYIAVVLGDKSHKAH